MHQRSLRVVKRRSRKPGPKADVSLTKCKNRLFIIPGPSSLRRDRLWRRDGADGKSKYEYMRYAIRGGKGKLTNFAYVGHFAFGVPKSRGKPKLLTFVCPTRGLYRPSGHVASAQTRSTTALYASLCFGVPLSLCGWKL